MTIPRREPIQLRALVLIVRTWQLCQVPLIRDFDSRPGVVSTEASLENQEMKIEMARNFLLYFLDLSKHRLKSLRMHLWVVLHLLPRCTLLVREAFDCCKVDRKVALETLCLCSRDLKV